MVDSLVQAFNVTITKLFDNADASKLFREMQEQLRNISEDENNQK